MPKLYNYPFRIGGHKTKFYITFLKVSKAFPHDYSFPCLKKAYNNNYVTKSKFMLLRFRYHVVYVFKTVPTLVL